MIIMMRWPSRTTLLADPPVAHIRHRYHQRVHEWVHSSRSFSDPLRRSTERGCTGGEDGVRCSWISTCIVESNEAAQREANDVGLSYEVLLRDNVVESCGGIVQAEWNILGAGVAGLMH